MWAVRTPKRSVPSMMFGRPIATACVLKHENRAQYPPILDVKPEAKLLRQELSHHEKIRDLRTVEEKAIGINMPRLD